MVYYDCLHRVLLLLWAHQNEVIIPHPIEIILLIPPLLKNKFKLLFKSLSLMIWVDKTAILLNLDMDEEDMAAAGTEEFSDLIKDDVESHDFYIMNKMEPPA